MAQPEARVGTRGRWQAGDSVWPIHGIVTFVRLSGEGWRERLLDKERVRLRGRR